MSEPIQQKITEVFGPREEIPLFFVESGSRLWGIESPDSDFDVRGFHLLSKQQYFDYQRPRDVIEVMDGNFDFVSYDVDKMFGLLAKSNPTVFEWIRSHIVYLNVLPDWENFQAQLIKNFSHKALFHHYLSLADGHLKLMQSGSKFTYKTAFYCIRGLLSADISSRREMPALLINDLFSQFDVENEVLKIAKESLHRKQEKREKQEVSEDERTSIVLAISDYRAQLAEKTPQNHNDSNQLSNLLSDYVLSLKGTYYR